MNLDRLNQLPADEAHRALSACCGATRWVEGMVNRRPFRDLADLFESAEAIWAALTPEDWREAFTHHPRIGDLDALRKRFGGKQGWAGSEQSGALAASEELLSALSEGNRVYEERFGHIFIVCATGKTAAEMLMLLEERLLNDPATELSVAASEQARITRLRLEKLVDMSTRHHSAITTHVLDTSRGRPAEGVPLALDHLDAEVGWKKLANAMTDADGRVKHLLPPDHSLASGAYRLIFDVATYYRRHGGECFYPSVPIHFEVKDTGQHYHVPLLLSPFGYSTYRGS